MATSEPTRYALIYGGNGALGGGCVTHFKAHNWWVANVELCKEEPIEPESDACSAVHVIHQDEDTASHRSANKEADLNILVHADKDMTEQEAEVSDALAAALEDRKLDAIICVAGGFSQGGALDGLVGLTDSMWQKNVWPAVVSASLAGKFLNSGGFLCLPGAKAARMGTPDAIAYGLSKAAVHQLTKSLASEGSGLPKNSLCIALLPVTLDTLINRHAMPNGDISAWTPTKYITDLLLKWSSGIERPDNGSLVQFITQNFITHVVFD